MINPTIISGINSSLKSAATVARPKSVPRFLYHLTTKKNYESIMKSGELKPYEDLYLRKRGVFLLDLGNFIKDWKSVRYRGGNIQDIQKALLTQVAKKPNIVALRIPTAKLNPDDLRIRSQKTFFQRQADEFNEEYGKIPEISLKLREKMIKHVQHGDSASNVALYKQRKEPFEFIYHAPIQKDNLQLVGETVFKYNDKSRTIKDIFLDLFKGCPEEIAFLHMKS